MTTLRDIGEREAIRRLARRLFPSVEEVVGIGDDCAVVRPEGSERDWVLTSDPVIEGTHFTAETDKQRVGNKAVGRVLSDIAAMGAEPSWLLINVVAPQEMEFAELEKVYAGAAALALKYGVAVMGGDLAQGPVLELHVFGVGQVTRDTAILRSGASAGDLIYVTGALGGSLAGRHLDFDPRVNEGLWLREQGWPSAMIDVSDGLASDLKHIVQGSRVGAEIQSEKVPIAEAAHQAGGERSPIEHALYDGEDFELLFTLSPEKKDRFEAAWKEAFDLPCTCMGQINERIGTISLAKGKNSREIVLRGGFEHFAQ